MRVAACQVNSRHDRAANLATAVELLERAAAAGADLAVLPEYVDYLGPAAGEPKPEPVDGEFAEVFAAAARRLGMWVVAGSFHELGPDADHTYNTSLVFDRAGVLAAAYRKIHLFDIDIPGPGLVPGVATVAPGQPGGHRGCRGCPVRPVDLLRPALSRALPAAGDRRRPGAARARRLHHPHRSGPLGGAVARPGDREPVLRGGGGPERDHDPGGAASGGAWSSTRGAPWSPRRWTEWAWWPPTWIWTGSTASGRSCPAWPTVAS